MLFRQYFQQNIKNTFPLFVGSAMLSTSAISVIKKHPSVARNLSFGSLASTTDSLWTPFCLAFSSASASFPSENDN
jgi:hypothetical protein